MKKTRASLSEVGLTVFPRDGQEWVIRGLGALSVRGGDHLIEVYLTPLGLRPRQEADFARRPVPLGVLPVLHLGSRWRDGFRVLSRGATRVERHRLCEVVPTGEVAANKQAQAFFAQHYWMPRDQFRHGFHVRTTARRRAGGGTGRWQDCEVLIPASVVFAAFYGTSSRLARLLSQMPHQEAISWERRLWLERMPVTDTPRSFYLESGTLRVCLSKLVDDGSARTVAWLFYESAARARARAVALHVAAEAGRGQPPHLRAALPFARPCGMEVEGVVSADGGQLLVTHVLACDYGLEGVTELIIDRENDARPAPLAAGVEVRPRGGGEGGRLREATDPEGRRVSTERAPDAGQRAAVWEVAGGLDVFPDLPVKKLPKKETTHEKAPQDLPDGAADAELGCGDGSYVRDLPPPVEVEAGALDGTLGEVAREVGFRFIVEVLRRLAVLGWQVRPAQDGCLLFEETATPRPRRRRPAPRLLGVEIRQGSAGAFLFEFEHREERAKPARTQTILAVRQDDEADLGLLLGVIFSSGEQAGRVARAGSLRNLWKVLVVKHQWVRRGRSEASAATFDAEEAHARRLERLVRGGLERSTAAPPF